MNHTIQRKIWDLHDNSISMQQFEQWVYDHTQELDAIESDDLVLELISFNYKSKYARTEFFSQFDSLIDWRAYESQRILGILQSIIDWDEKIGESLLATYDLYCYGYDFLSDLGMGPGSRLASNFNYGVTPWHELPASLRKELIEEVYEEANREATQAKDLIESGKIILTGRRGGEFNRYIYEDLRSEHQKVPYTAPEELARSSVAQRIVKEIAIAAAIVAIVIFLIIVLSPSVVAIMGSPIVLIVAYVLIVLLLYGLFALVRYLASSKSNGGR